MAEDKVNRAGCKVKQYLDGQLHQFFAYSIEMGAVRLHEVILSSAPCTLYYDIKFKKKEMEGTYNLPVYRSILCDMEKRLCPLDDPLFPVANLVNGDVEEVDNWTTTWENIMQDWDFICSSEFSPFVCSYDVDYMEDFICTFVRETLDADLLGINLKTTTGCRYGKFSCRIFLPVLWFDSNVVSMSLFVFELARALQRENFVKAIRLLKMCKLLIDTGLDKKLLDKVRFHVHAVMLDIIPLGKTDLNDVSYLRYLGIGNTPVDESVYTMSQNLRCVGSTKPSVGAMGPYVKGCNNIFPNLTFSTIFNPFDKRIEDLLSNRDQFTSYLITIADRCNPSETIVVQGLQPTSSYPRPRWWEHNKQQL
jgi:hypothetical protein